jgi:hypothetical protein
MTRRQKFQILVLSGVAVAAMILLSAGLAGLEFSPGKPLPRSKTAESVSEVVGLPPGNRVFEILMMALFFLAQLLLPFAIIYLIVSPEARRQVLRKMGNLLWLVALYLFLRAQPFILNRGTEAEPPEASSLREAVPDVEFVADSPPWLVLVTTLGLAVLAAGMLVGFVWFIWRRRRSESPLEQLAQEAQEALHALQAGADLRNTVLRCYLEMSRVLREQRGIARAEGMTTREFERHLEEAGLADEHVRRLTRLFEEVRYGARVPGQQQERQAIACLTAIVEACQSPL